MNCHRNLEKIRPLILRASNDQRQLSSSALQPEQLVHLTKLADGASTLRRGSLNLEPRLNNLLQDTSSVRCSSMKNLSASPLIPRRRLFPNSHNLQCSDKGQEKQTSNLVWIGGIVVAIIAVISGSSVLLRTYIVF